MSNEMKKDVIEDTLEKQIIDRILPEVREKVIADVNELTKSATRRIKRVVVKMPNGEEKRETNLVHEKFDEILLLVNNNIPVMLTGGAGSGKSSACEKVAEVLRFRFLF